MVIDLEKVARSAVEQIVQSELIEKAIEKKLAETIVHTVNDALERYSEFGKQLREKVRAALAVHGDIDLPSYNDLILKVVRRQVEHATHQCIEKQVVERMAELLTPAPAKISLSQLIKDYVDSLRERSRGGCVCYGEEESRAFVELTKDPQYSWWDLKLAKKRKKESYSSYRDGEIGIHIHSDGDIGYLRFGGVDQEKQLFVGPLYNFERSIFQMKAAKTLIEIDLQPDDIESIDLDYGPRAQ